MYVDLLTYFAGTKRLRSSNNEVADMEHVSKKHCAVSSAAQQVVQTDQVCLHLHRLRCFLLWCALPLHILDNQLSNDKCHANHVFADAYTYYA